MFSEEGQTISVVVTTYNRASLLARCLDALLDQEGAPPYEIVVVDDGSTDDTARLAQLRDPRVRYVPVPHGGRAAARNAGLEAARGEVLIYVDSDVFVVPGFVAAHAACLSGAKGPVFSQGVSVDVPRPVDPRHPGLGARDLSRAFFDTKNVAAPTELLREAGGFSPEFSEYGWEDLELGLRLKDRGVRMARARGAIGFHCHPPFEAGRLDQQARLEEERGRMGARFYRLRPTLEVKLMVGLTPLHAAACWLLTAGGQREDGAWPWLVRALEKRPALAGALIPGLLFPRGRRALLEELAARSAAAENLNL